MEVSRELVPLREAYNAVGRKAKVKARLRLRGSLVYEKSDGCS